MPSLLLVIAKHGDDLFPPSSLTKISKLNVAPRDRRRPTIHFIFLSAGSRAAWPRAAVLEVVVVVVDKDTPRRRWKESFLKPTIRLVDNNDDARPNRIDVRLLIHILSEDCMASHVGAPNVLPFLNKQCDGMTDFCRVPLL
jgi:hypothetical protein